jgi:hypothetical protein
MTTVRHDQQALDTMTSTDAVAVFLMSRPGERFTGKQLAAELDRPLGTVQSAAGKLHAARMRSTEPNPVGVYAFRPTDDCRYITYAYRTDRPFDSDLHPVKDHQFRSETERAAESKRQRDAKAKAEAKAACTLTPTSIDGIYITGNGDLVRLVPVEIVDA